MNTIELYAKRDAEDVAKIEALRQHAAALRSESADALAAACAEYRAASNLILDAYSRSTRNRGYSGYKFDVNINTLEHEARAAYMRMHEIEWPLLMAEWAVRHAIRKAARDHAQRAADMGEDYSNAWNERREQQWELHCDQYANRDFTEWMERGERADARAKK